MLRIKPIAEVLEGRKCQNINIDTLDDLMLATEVKIIQRNGIRFLNCDYFDERLYVFKSKVLIKYNLFNLTKIKVFTTKGEYLCTAERVTETHPMAKILGNVKDFEDYKQKIVKQRQLRKKTINSVKQYLSNEEVKFIEQKMDEPKEIEFKPRLNTVQTLFKNNSEKYEYLIANNSWVAEFKQTKEYKLLYEMNNYKSIETLRDVHDETDCPIIFIGMGLAHRKLERYKHLYDRFSEILKFECFGINDIGQIINQLSEIKFTPEAIEYIYPKFNRFRQIVRLINQMENFAKDNNLSEITKEVMEQIIWT